MKKNSFASKTAETDIDITGMHYSEITDVFKPDGGGEEVVVNEEEHNETVSQDKDELNGSD